eukprot:jgi/Orpsp1_1/1174251/evm.model.c7180000049399.2
MENNKILSNDIEQAVLFGDTEEFSFYLSKDNLVSLHFSKTGQTLLYEIPFNDENSIFPSHIRPSLLLSYSTTFQSNSYSTQSNLQNLKSNEKLNLNIQKADSLKQPTIINKQKTKFILSKYKNNIKKALNIRNMYSLYPYFPLEWIMQEKNNWFRTNSKLEYVHWPFFSSNIQENSTTTTTTNNNNNNDNNITSNLYYNSLFQKLNITISSNNATIIQSLDKYVTITMSSHYQ